MFHNHMKQQVLDPRGALVGVAGFLGELGVKKKLGRLACPF
jgi:hypothetical protein